MKNATSISVSIFKKIITPAGKAVNCFGGNREEKGALSFDNTRGLW